MQHQNVVKCLVCFYLGTSRVSPSLRTQPPSHRGPGGSALRYFYFTPRAKRLFSLILVLLQKKNTTYDILLFYLEDTRTQNRKHLRGRGKVIGSCFCPSVRPCVFVRDSLVSAHLLLSSSLCLAFLSTFRPPTKKLATSRKIQSAQLFAIGVVVAERAGGLEDENRGPDWQGQPMAPLGPLTRQTPTPPTGPGKGRSVIVIVFFSSRVHASHLQQDTTTSFTVLFKFRYFHAFFFMLVSRKKCRKTNSQKSR